MALIDSKRNSRALPPLLKLIRSVDFPHKLGLLDRVYGKTLSAYGICWVDTAAGLPWRLDLANPILRWIVYGKYEGPEFLNWARAFLPMDGVVVDSGANIGQMLLYLAQWTPRGKVLAFEPNDHAANWLSECLAANPQLPVELIRKGLGEKSACLYLLDQGRDYNHGAQSFVTQNQGAPINIVSLADELKARGFDHVDLWKLDVEGYEEQALRGAEQMLIEKRIRAVYAEMRGAAGELTRHYMTSVGYQLHSLSTSGIAVPTDQPVIDGNGLFLPA